MTVAWCYLVVSSGQQADTIEHQRAWAQETAKQKGWRIDRYFEGVKTGKHGVRSILKDLAAQLFAADSLPDWVLMIRLDRVGRGSIAESQFLLHEINSRGVRIWTYDGEEKNDTATDEFMRSAKLFMARHDNDIRREKARMVHVRKRREGKHPGYRPYGVTIVDGKPIPYLPEAQVVRDIFARRLEGWGIHRLCRYAAAHGPDKTMANGEPRKMAWGMSTIKKMLACRTYRGSLIDEDTFDAVQGIALPGIDRDAPKYPWPLRGVLKCTCGLSVSVAFCGREGSRKRYYVCRNMVEHGRCYYHRADVVEANFVELMRSLVVDPTLYHDEAETDLSQVIERAKSLDQEIRDLEVRRLKVWEIAESAGIPASEVGRRVNELNAQIKDLERSRAEIKRVLARATGTGSRHHLATLIADMVEKWNVAPVEMQREVALAVAEVLGGLVLKPGENEVTRA